MRTMDRNGLMRCMIAACLSVASAGALQAQTPRHQGLPSVHPDSLAGCWEIQPGEWQRSASFRRLMDPERVPRRFRLTTEWSEDWSPMQTDSLPYRTVIASSGRYLTTWRHVATDSDSVMIGSPLAFGGISLRLARHSPGELRGRITAFTDVVEEDRPGVVELPVIALRTECDGLAARAPARRHARHGGDRDDPIVIRKERRE